MTRQVTMNLHQVAKGIALAMGLFFLAGLVPVFGLFIAVLMPLPVLFSGVKSGRAGAVAVAGISLAAMTALSLPPGPDLLFFGQLLLLGLCLAEMVRRQAPVEWTVGLSSAFVLAATAAAIVVAGWLRQQGPVEMVAAYVAHNLELTLSLYEQMGVSQQTLTALSNAMDTLNYVLLRMMPSLAAASLLIVAWSNTLMCRPVLAKEGLAVHHLDHLHRWKAPESLIWVLIAASAAVVLLPAKSALKITGLNVLLVTLVIYFFQGIAIVAAFFHSKQAPRPIRVLVYTLLALQWFLLLVVVGLGIFDLWVDFRKRLDTSSRPEA